MQTLNITQLRGRLFDEQAHCNTSSNPLHAAVAVIQPNQQWALTFSLTQPSAATVTITVDRSQLVAARKGEEEEIPLFATGLLFGDARSELQLDEHGQALYDSQNRPVYRAPTAVSGPFEGARLQCWDAREVVLRVDCLSLLPFYIECILTLSLLQN